MKKIINLLLLGAFSITVFGQVQFSDPQNIGSLNIESRTKSFSRGEHSKTITLEISTSDVELFNIGQDFEVLKIKGVTTTGKPNDPITYLKSAKVLLPKNARVTGVSLIEGNYVEIINKINLAPEKSPSVYLKKDRTNKTKLTKNLAVYGKDALFPGKAVAYISGNDQNNLVVYVKIYPVQYNPVKKKTFLITSAQIEVNYVLEPGGRIEKSANTTNAVNLIITVPDFNIQADSLKSIHENLENITTEVVTTDWIKNNYDPAPLPTQDGYANVLPTPVNSQYDYDLARRIVAYLRDNSAHPNLESVTLLGDADKVPPAYYFYIPHFQFYDDWIASDMFYASPDYDLVLNFEVGRLPATNIAGATLMVNKIRNWKNNLNTNWFNNVQLIGGQPFSREALCGELILLDLIDNEYLKGMNIGKNFLSNGKQTKQNVLTYLSDGNNGIISMVDHGDGNKMYVGSEEISYIELLNLPAADKYPVLITPACRNAGYDAELMDNCSFTHSIGEGVLRSNAGAVAYYGGTRVNYAGIGFAYDNIGRLNVTRNRFMDQLLAYTLKAYDGGSMRLGQMAKQSIDSYVQDFDMSYSVDYVTIYEFVFLGDPALTVLPPATAGSSYNPVEFSVDPYPNEWGLPWFPIYYRTATTAIPVTVTGETNSPFVNIGVYGVSPMGVTEKVNTSDNSVPFSCTYEPQNDEVHMTRFETADYKEKRIYYFAWTVDQLPPTRFELLSIDDQGSGNYNLTWSSSKDYDGNSISYTLKEMINPTSVTDDCNTYDRWENDGFTISNDGYNSTNCFQSPTGNNVLCHFVSDVIEVKEGDVLRFWTKYDLGDEMMSMMKIEIKEVNAMSNYKLLKQFTYKNLNWTELTFSLRAYAGKFVNIRFNLEGNTVPAAGIKIDNIYPAAAFQNLNLITDLTDTTYQVSNVNSQDNDYYYQVRAIDSDNLKSPWTNYKKVIYGSYSDITDKENEDPLDWSLSQNYPNPFNPVTSIRYKLKQASDVKLTIYNMQGQKVRTLIDLHKQAAGSYNIQWNGTNDLGQKVVCGNYFYRLEASDFVDIKKMIIIK